MTRRIATRFIAAACLCLAGQTSLGAPEASGDSTLRAMQDQFRRVADRLRPCMVRIETVGGTQPTAPQAPREEKSDPDEGGEPNEPKKPRLQNPFREEVGSRFAVADGPTTGLVWSSDGYIVTSSFNFVREPALVSVVLADGRRLAADVVARDQVRKIALLKIDARDLPVPTWTDLQDVRVGESVVALGLGFGTEAPSLTVGIVSAFNRMRGNALQTDAKLSPANYGGPLCDLYGRVLGINVPMAQRPGELAGAEMYDSGVGFAVPKERLDAIVGELVTGRSFYRGWLGLNIEPRIVDALVIHNVADPSPVRAAGLLPGDKILTIDGRRINHYGNLVQSLNMRPAGEEVLLEVDRNGAAFSVKVRLGRIDELGPMPELEEPFDPSNPLPAPEPEENP